MEVLKATEQQKQELEKKYLKGCELQFVKDADGNWIVGAGVVTNINFAPIHEELKQLQIIPHNPRRTQKI